MAPPRRLRPTFGNRHIILFSINEHLCQTSAELQKRQTRKCASEGGQVNPSHIGVHRGAENNGTYDHAMNRVMLFIAF